MVSMNLSSQMKINSGQPAALSATTMKNAPKAFGQLVTPTQDEVTFLLSQQAKKLLEDKKEAEKQKMQETLDKLRERSISLKQIKQNSNQDDRAKKIAEIKSRLQQLMARMRSVLLFGDKRGAALIAKEAAQLAKQLKALGGSGGPGESMSVPSANPSGESSESGVSAQSAQSVQSAEGAEGLSSEEMSAGEEMGNNGEIGNAGEAEAKAAEVEAAAAQAKEPQAETGEVKEGGSLKEDERVKEAEQAKQSERAEQKEQKEQTEKAEEKRKVGEVANDLMAMARALVAKHESNASSDAAEQREKQEIISMLRAIISMAKQVVKQKTNPISNKPENPQVDSITQAEVSTAEKEVEDAIRSIMA